MDPDFLVDSEHQHDASITSVGIARAGDLDLALLNAWFTTLLKEQGVK